MIKRRKVSLLNDERKGLIHGEMKIQFNNYSYPVNPKGSRLQQGNQTNIRERNLDQLEMSSSSKLLKDCVEKAKKLDHDRQTRVQAIKAKIEAGTYQVSSEAIADAMLDEGFFSN